MHIYVIKNNINSKYYVGKSEKEPNNNYLGSGKAIKNAVKKYGKENFEKLIIMKNIKDNYLLDKFEKMYIRLFKIKFQENCYNIAEGGNGGNNNKYKSENEKKEFSEKMSKLTSKENNGFYGKKHTEETKIKCGINNIGRKPSDEHINNLKEINKGNTYNLGRKHSKEVNMLKGSPGEKNGMFGKKHTEETVDKISQQISLSKIIKCICEHCSKEADKGNYNRWHSDNCKLNPNITAEQLLKREPHNKIKI